MSDFIHKDEMLDRLAATANVAQFVSFGTGGDQRFSRIHGHSPNSRFASIADAVEALLAASPEKSVNVRSYELASPKSREFIYGIKSVPDVVTAVRRLSSGGLFTIVNETIDVDDGGVSGVSFGNVIEFAPGDTPRCVEKPGTFSVSSAIGNTLLQTVYGFAPALGYSPDLRVEFSIHPIRRGYENAHTVVWEMERVPGVNLRPDPRWPNRFSRLLGDKAFGLLVAHVIGLSVPSTTVLARRIAPFRFGRSTGTAETWIRTCPFEQMPGKFSTYRGWRDPFELLATEDPDGKALSSVIAQEGVDAKFSGALVTSSRGQVTVEGVAGFGDQFMKGETGPAFRMTWKPGQESGREEVGRFPKELRQSIDRLAAEASHHLGPVRFEWAFDGTLCWILQLHRGATVSTGRTIVPGERSSYKRFDVTAGLDALRELISRVHREDTGIILVGDVGITSHFGDVLRRSGIPSRLEPTRLESTEANR